MQEQGHRENVQALVQMSSSRKTIEKAGKIAKGHCHLPKKPRSDIFIFLNMFKRILESPEKTFEYTLALKIKN